MSHVSRTELRSLSGRLIDFRHPTPDDFNIEDIATGLSHLCRFAGQVGSFISVAHHSVMVARAAAAAQRTPAEQLYALLHDAPEAYLADVPSPLKKLLPLYSEIEERMLDVIVQKFIGLSDFGRLPSWLKELDDNRLALEKQLYQEGGSYPLAQSPTYWRDEFLDNFRQLRILCEKGDSFDNSIELDSGSPRVFISATLGRRRKPRKRVARPAPRRRQQQRRKR